MIRAYKYRKLEPDMHTKLPFVTVNKGDSTFYFKESIPQNYSLLTTRMNEELKGSSTMAFLIIRNDSIIYENYADGFTATSLFPSFSVAKSFVSTLVGIALQEGKIRSLQEPFTNYLPKFLKKNNHYSSITLQHLLDMRSGLDWNEGSYGLKDDAIKMGFRPNITPYVYKVRMKEPPGKFEYQSINTMLLAMVVEKATGMSISSYLQQKIWQPLQMENTATWTTDKHDRELVYAGINATAKDFAKLGRLYLHHGYWNGKQIINTEWVNTTTGIENMKAAEGYKNQFWGTNAYKEFADSITAAENAAMMKASNGKVYSYKANDGSKKFYISYTSPSFYAQGILGQFVYVNPTNNTIIVRLGKEWSKNYSLERFVASVSDQL